MPVLPNNTYILYRNGIYGIQPPNGESLEWLGRWTIGEDNSIKFESYKNNEKDGATLGSAGDARDWVDLYLGYKPESLSKQRFALTGRNETRLPKLQEFRTNPLPVLKAEGEYRIYANGLIAYRPSRRFSLGSHDFVWVDGAVERVSTEEYPLDFVQFTFKPDEGCYLGDGQYVVTHSKALAMIEEFRRSPISAVKSAGTVRALHDAGWSVDVYEKGGEWIVGKDSVSKTRFRFNEEKTMLTVPQGSSFDDKARETQVKLTAELFENKDAPLWVYHRDPDIAKVLAAKYTAEGFTDVRIAKTYREFQAAMQPSMRLTA